MKGIIRTFWESSCSFSATLHIIYDLPQRPWSEAATASIFERRIVLVDQCGSIHSRNGHAKEDCEGDDLPRCCLGLTLKSSVFGLRKLNHNFPFGALRPRPKHWFPTYFRVNARLLTCAYGWDSKLHNLKCQNSTPGPPAS